MNKYQIANIKSDLIGFKYQIISIAKSLLEIRNWRFVRQLTDGDSRRGFTLIELIIVISILGILVMSAIVTLNPAEQYAKALDARRKADLSQIQKALESYYQDSDGRYPISDSEYQIIGGTNPIPWGSSWAPYMTVLPKEPTGGKKYAYYSEDGSSYYIYASLDRGAKDPQSCQTLNGDGECFSVPTTSLCGVGNKCNYGLSSPNVSP